MSPDPPPLDWDIDPHQDPYHGDPIGNEDVTIPHLNDSAIGKTLFARLSDRESTPTAGLTTKGVPLEYIADFFDGYHKIVAAAPDVAVQHHEIWSRIGQSLQQARDAFQATIDRLKNSQKFTGATATALFQHAADSLGYLGSLADAAHRMDPLVDAFSRDISETRDWFISMHNSIEKALGNGGVYSNNPAAQDEMYSFVNAQAQRVIQTFYNPPIEWISQSHPDMSASAPQVGGPAAGPRSPALGGWSPGGPSPGGSGAPGIPSLSGLHASDPPPGQPDAPAATTPTNALPGLDAAAEGAGDAAQGAGQQAQNAAGQAGNAANQALGDLSKGARNGAADLPEGVLGLGPHGLKGVTTGAGSGRGGGGGGGTGAHSPSASKPSAQVTQGTRAVTAAQASRAGVGAGAGTPGAGAPVAGQRGAGADKEHKANRALRHAKHGEEVIGDVEAVVPVVGGEGHESGAATPSSQRRRESPE
ncbi:hypothetical protein [Mycobacterium camsae]|uniref:hypothetical protein n=1 Tax=Mycobacterium gordonae TaxID=1778 RepID=UPI00197D2031|nr:hypothetical protein [Mycobacterium gordonae]